MHIVTVEKISLSHAGRAIFRDLSFAIGDHDRTGLVGPNGAGKSSLLKALAGQHQPDSGAVVRMRGVRVSYLPQEPALPPERRLIDVAQTLPPALAALNAELHAAEDRLGDPAVYNDPDALQAALDTHERLLARFEALGGTLHTNRVRALLAHLGFDTADYDLLTDTLSGGQKKLVALAMLAAEQPEVLLLDEPDNHLDLDAKRKLESFLRDYPGAVVIVSHDRYLLDEVVTQIAELEDGALTVYPGSYSAFAIEKEQRRERQQQAYVAQQKRIQQIETAIKRFEFQAKVVENERAARQARSRRKMLERMEERGEIIDQVRERRLMALSLEGGRGSTKALELKRLAMAFDDEPLFFDLDLLVRHGQRVGLIGPNGAGKSVLFRLILGELTPLEGEIKLGPSSRVGYYAQEHQTLTAWWDATPVDVVRDIRAMPEGSAVAQLLKFAFTYPQVRQPVGTLSGGERSRLQLLALMLQQPNLLLLDEPTNNLDIASAEVLENALNEFEGAMLVISHDRYFLDRTVDRVVELADGVLTGYDGGYSDYLAAQAQRSTRR